MAFFPRTVYNTQPSFVPLFRFLDDFDQSSRGSSRGGCPARRPAPQWQPRFDVRETADAYHLHGELPGLEKEQISIEFPEAQELVIRGKVERTYTAGSPPAATVESTTTEKPAAIAEETPKRRTSHGSQNSYQATVQDEDEASADEEAVLIDTPDETIAEEKSEEPATEATMTEAAPAADTAKYWLHERRVGEFSRAFSFQSHIDREAVSASLNNGILTVVIPKAQKPEARRITIF